MSICHHELRRFQTAATRWGCEHEHVARDKYTSVSSASHDNFRVEECGFFLSTEYPFIGASPDGLVTCACCSDGICEIKVCSITLLCMLVHKIITQINICSVLIVTKGKRSKRQLNTATSAWQKNGMFHLRHSHSYFYQVWRRFYF